MYSLELGVFMYKFFNKDLPLAFKEYFHKRSSIHDYLTRHVNDLNLTNNKKSFSDHSIRTCAPILCNSLPTALYSNLDSKSVTHFLNQFKHKLFQTYTANRVGQNLSTFAQRWVKYQQSKLFGQFDPTMGKT